MNPSAEQSTSRRDFGKALAALATTGGVAAAQDKPPEKPKSVEAPASAADALLEAVRIRFGKNLTPEQLDAVKRSLNRHQFLANRLKQFKLKNGDEPATVFSAEVSESTNR